MIFKNKKDTKLPLYLQNTLSGKKEEFKPLEDGKVRMYNCGPTVYNEPQVGNLRSYIFADILRRTLEYNGYEVQQVINITDVGHLVADSEDGEDKMEKRAKETGEAAQTIAGKITETFLGNLTSLGINIEHIQFPKATDFIQEQIEMTKALVEKGYAYVIDNGVAFDTAKFKDYGKLGNINLKEQEAGARVETDPQKHNSADFWLWKFNKGKEKRQQEWESPWGRGFPGWHLECSAMSRSLLGRQLDIHTGGIDHIPVHHNNEIAQSEAVSGKKFVNYWMHNAFLMFDGKRFEKSTGHVLYLRQIIDRGYSPLAFRYLLLTSKYNVEQNFTWEALDGASTALLKLRRYYVENLASVSDGELNETYRGQFAEAVNDDLGTPRAISVLWEMVKDDAVPAADKKVTMQDFDRVLGLSLAGSGDEKTKLKVTVDNTPEEVLELLEQRKEAREQKDWQKSDDIRDKVETLGYKIIDKGDEQKLSTL